MLRRLYMALLLLFACSTSTFAYGKVQGWCQDGGYTVSIAGVINASTNRFQRTFPSCTVTVYLTGTVTVATLYSDDGKPPTAKANPFTAASTGQWSFYAAEGRYDVRFSGGGIASPFTLGDQYAFDTARPTNLRVPCDPKFNAATAGARISLAITDLPSTGGIIDGRCFEGAQTWAVDFFNGVTKPIRLLLGSGTNTLSVNMTVPVTASISFGNASIISVNNAITLTINGPVDAGLYKIFAWTGTGAINFVSGGNLRSVPEVPVEWFGATDANTSTDDSAYFLKAIASVDNTEGIVKLAKKQYCIGAALTGASFSMHGEGLTQLLTNAAGGTTCANMGAVDFLTVTGGRQGLDFSDFGIYGTATQNDGIDMTNEISWRWSNLIVDGFTKVGAACFKINGSYSGNFYDGHANTCNRGIEINRSGANGSGGVSVYGFHSSDITSFGIRIVASAAIGLFNCEFNVYGAGGFGAYIVGDATNPQISTIISGGLYAGETYPIHIGEAGTQPVRGISIHGALISGCTNPPCVGTSGAASAGIRVVSGLVFGADISGNHFQLTGSAVRTTGAIDKDFWLGPNSVTNLVAPAYYLNENGTQVTDIDGNDLNGRPFVSGECNHITVTGTSSYKCGDPAMRLSAIYVPVGNVGGGVDKLMTYTIPAAFFNTGRVLKLDFYGNTNTNANNKTVSCYWGAQLLTTFGPTAANGQTWSMSVTLTAGVNVAYWKVSDKWWNGAAVAPSVAGFGGNITDPREIYCEGTGTNNDDIVQYGQTVELLP